jgi:hypothetical protein
MADAPRSPKAGDHAGHEPERGRRSGTSRWLIVVGIVIAVALLGLLVFLHLSGAIGPGIH